MFASSSAIFWLHLRLFIFVEDFFKLTSITSPYYHLTHMSQEPNNFKAPTSQIKNLFYTFATLLCIVAPIHYSSHILDFAIRNNGSSFFYQIQNKIRIFRAIAM